jgi:hypothetical protein
MRTSVKFVGLQARSHTQITETRLLVSRALLGIFLFEGEAE